MNLNTIIQTNFQFPNQTNVYKGKVTQLDFQNVSEFLKVCGPKT